MAVWALVGNIIIAVGTWKLVRFINTGFVHFIYNIITLIFWIAVGVRTLSRLGISRDLSLIVIRFCLLSMQAALETAISGSAYPHRTTLRACEWLGWISMSSYAQLHSKIRLFMSCLFSGAILIFFVSLPWTLLGVAHTGSGIRGAVAPPV